MSYTRFTITERAKIVVYLELGYSIRKMGRQIGRNPSSIPPELKRNLDYQTERARANYKRTKATCCARLKLSLALKVGLQEKFDSNLVSRTDCRISIFGLPELQNDLSLAILQHKEKGQQSK